MCSALQAEVAALDDPTTQINRDLVSKLASYRKVLCCGPSKSHAVNYTVRNLAEVWPEERLEDIVVLGDACSSMPGFTDIGVMFETDMRRKGVTWKSAQDFKVEEDSQRQRRLAVATGSHCFTMGAAMVLNGCPLESPSTSGITLLIVTPQNDFYPPHGTLAAPNAVDDAERIAWFLERHASTIDRVVVTLKARHKLHIAHASFWIGRDGKAPEPSTIIQAKDIKSGQWKARQPEMESWSLEYARKLERLDQDCSCRPHQIHIWPDHCLMGSPGYSVYEPLANALNVWAARRARTVTWILIDQSNRTEMYSSFRAVVDIPDDPATKLNESLLMDFQSSQRVICCGQTQCLNHTVRDLCSTWPKDRMEDIVVLSDGCSVLNGFEDDAHKFEKDMMAKGVGFRKAQDVFTVVRRPKSFFQGSP
jgi:nicotinamidase-related amidase